jgi:enoyl-CoA hydratase/carnithine racemase
MSSTAQTEATEEVAVSVSPAGLGRITLCRDRQLNALGAAHVEILRAQLLQWSAAAASGGSDGGVTCVLLDSNNDRSFCSGGGQEAV